MYIVSLEFRRNNLRGLSIKSIGNPTASFATLSCVETHVLADDGNLQSEGLSFVAHSHGQILHPVTGVCLKILFNLGFINIKYNIGQKNEKGFLFNYERCAKFSQRSRVITTK